MLKSNIEFRGVEVSKKMSCTSMNANLCFVCANLKLTIYIILVEFSSAFQINLLSPKLF